MSGDVNEEIIIDPLFSSNAPLLKAVSVTYFVPGVVKEIWGFLSVNTVGNSQLGGLGKKP